MRDYPTYATLKNDTPFNKFFPENKVPIRSLIPIVPRLEAPKCYELDPQYLTKKQIVGLAKLVYQNWRTECTSLEMATQFVENGLPINGE